MKKIIFLITFMFSLFITAQKLTKKQIDSLPNTIENQFIKTYQLSSTWHEYKMIKKPYFLKFKKNILDSISNLKKTILFKQKKVSEQEIKITLLNQKILSLNNKLTQSKNKENTISLFGNEINKATYNSILLFLIILLNSSLVFYIYKFNHSNILTKNSKKELDELNEDFELHRKKSIEREQKLRRQLQDEINKQRGV